MTTAAIDWGQLFELIWAGALAGVGVSIAFATLINPTAGRTVFQIPGPMFKAAKKEGFDWSMRNVSLMSNSSAPVNSHHSCL